MSWKISKVKKKHYLWFVKILLLIFHFLFASLFGGAGVECPPSQVDVFIQSEAESSDNRQDYRQTDLLPVSTARLSAEESSVTSYVRTSNSVRRNHPSTKFPFRIIKAGKIVDRTNYYTFQSSILQFQSGIFSTRRYIHAICRLLI